MCHSCFCLRSHLLPSLPCARIQRGSHKRWATIRIQHHATKINTPPSSPAHTDGHVVHTLVATGTIYKVDPYRVICKKVVLSGHPLKIHRRSAVVRYLFFNRGVSVVWWVWPRWVMCTLKGAFVLCLSALSVLSTEDILWFKPVELQTKHGRRGHIKEPLGIHILRNVVFAHGVYIAVWCVCA